MMLKYLIQTSIFRYSKNYGSLIHETRIKDSVNMEDLICLLATVRTLKTSRRFIMTNFILKYFKSNDLLGYFFFFFCDAKTLFSAIFHVFCFVLNFRYFPCFPYRGKLATLGKFSLRLVGSAMFSPTFNLVKTVRVS